MVIFNNLVKAYNQIRKRIQSEPESYPELEPFQFFKSLQSVGKNLVFLKTLDLTGKFYTDQTGQFSMTSSKVNTYILLAYRYDSNKINAEILKLRTRLELRNEYNKLHNLLVDRGLKPILHSMYNECPNVLKLLWEKSMRNNVIPSPNLSQKFSITGHS